MTDKIEKLRNSVIQHGKFNDRIYLMKLNLEDLPYLIDDMEDLAKKNNYSKIFAKIPLKNMETFKKYGYNYEASIPGYYESDDLVFASKFFTKERVTITESSSIDQIIKMSQSKPLFNNSELSCDIYKATSDNVIEIAQVYKTVFESYPFPIFNPDYLIETMQSHVDYYFIKQDGKIVSIASSENDYDNSSSEMTDFATLPGYRGKSFSTFILAKMEEESRKNKLRTLYTIARSISHGMNITFARLGYKYSGTLVNNTFICNQLESMNIWYKSLNR